VSDNDLAPIIEAEQLAADVADRLDLSERAVSPWVDCEDRLYVHGERRPSVDFGDWPDADEAARAIAEEYIAVGERMLKEYNRQKEQADD